MQNEIIDLRTDERVDNLPALLLVTDEQLADRDRVAESLTKDSPGVSDLMRRVFGSDTPSVESWLADDEEALVAA